MELYVNKILCGDSREELKKLPDGIARTCVTSPPYLGLRDYGVEGQIGLEETVDEYVSSIVSVMREVWRVLTPDGTLWLNLGDTYVSAASDHRYNKGLGKHSILAAKTASGLPNSGRAERNKSLVANGLKQKDMIGIPWRVAFALQADGWYLRSDIIWHKPNAMPESVRDRPTKAHEYIFLLSKSEKYFYDAEAIKENAVNGDPNSPRGSVGVINNPMNGGQRKQDALGKRQYTGFNKRYQPVTKRNKRTVWSVTVKPYKGSHFATYPPELIEPCILAGSQPNDIVLDPFFGSGTTGEVALLHGRNFIGCELNPKYVDLAHTRLPETVQMDLFQVCEG